MKAVSETAEDPVFTPFEKPQQSNNQPVQQQPAQHAASSTQGQTGQNNPGAQSTNQG
jgi:hypothetical protein